MLPPPLQQSPSIVFKLDDRARNERGISDRQPFHTASQIWEGGQLFETARGGLEGLGPGRALRFGRPPTDRTWSFTYDLVEGAAYAWGRGDDRASGQKGRDLKDIRSTLYIYRNGGARWELWDTFRVPPDAVLAWLRPLEGGGYLLGGRFPDEEMRRQDALAIARNNGHGRLVIHETEGLDPDHPDFLYGRPNDLLSPRNRLPGINDQPRWYPNPAVQGGLFSSLGSQTIRIPGHLVFIDLRLGRFLCINSRSGRIERQASLFSLPDDALKAPWDYETAVLGAQPRPDGHLLIAARSAEAVQQSRTWKPDLPPPEPVRLSASEAFGKTAEEQGEAIEMKQEAVDGARAQQAQEARLKAFPDLVWWDFDPDTGAFRREPPPQGVPDRFPSLAALQAFSFRFKADGNLDIEPQEWK